MDLGPDGVAIEEREPLAALGGLVDPRAELRHLVESVGDVEHAGLLEVAVDPVAADEGDELGEVLAGRAARAGRLVGEVALAVRPPVDQARLTEPAVASARSESRRVAASSDHDPQRGIGVGQARSRPTAR